MITTVLNRIDFSNPDADLLDPDGNFTIKSPDPEVCAALVDKGLTPRWYPLNKHPVQEAFWISPARFQIIPAGKRSGKTEIAKRKLVRAAISFHSWSNGRFVCCAPTHAQAKEIFWDDLLEMVPKWALRGGSIEKATRVSPIPTIYLKNGAKIQVFGLDKPARIEGTPVDGIVIDEFADCKANVWTNYIRATLSTPGRPGWAIFIGVPEGRNHYYALWCKAKSEGIEDGIGVINKSWQAFTWKTADINPVEAETAKSDMDYRQWMQEYCAEFLNFEGRAYYAFDSELNVTPKGKRVTYDASLPLHLSFDFNRKPGVCAISQEQRAPAWLKEATKCKDIISAGIDEVFIERMSNTKIVCQKILEKWSNHERDVLLFGDPTGGAGGSAKVLGSDWQIIKDILKPVFGHRLKDRVQSGSPGVRVSINSVNTRLITCSGEVGTVLDAKACPMLIRDFEGVESDDAGDIVKEEGSMLTHISDGWRYMTHRLHPCGKEKFESTAA